MLGCLSLLLVLVRAGAGAAQELAAAGVVERVVAVLSERVLRRREQLDTDPRGEFACLWGGCVCFFGCFGCVNGCVMVRP